MLASNKSVFDPMEGIQRGEQSAERSRKGGVTRMIKLLIIAALAAAVAAPAFAQTVPSNAIVITVPVLVQTVPRLGGVIGAGPRQDEPVLPGTSVIPGPVFPSMAQKSLDSPTGK